MKTPKSPRVLALFPTIVFVFVAAFSMSMAAPPDLTSGGVIDPGAKSNLDWTFNLGPTGMRGWAYYTLPGDTGESRQIQVTHVHAGSPADGILAIDDVILGADGTGASPGNFSSDARKSLALAIQDAEANTPAELKLLRWRAGSTTTVTLTLQTLGAYTATAPYSCPKSAAILSNGLAHVYNNEAPGRYSFGAMSLIATDNATYEAEAQVQAHALIPDQATLDELMSDERDANGLITWQRGHTLLFLAEYYLATNDALVLPAIEAYALNIAKNQSLFGTVGHIYADKWPDGSPNGPMGGVYGVVNSAGMPCFLGVLLAKECGLTNPELDPAIEASSRFLAYYTDKGAIPYGEGEPYIAHESNGKSGLGALYFHLQNNRVEEGKYFAKMATASANERERGHTGAWFNYLWAPLGAASGGEEAAAAYFSRTSWMFDLSRRWDGGFDYDCLNGEGPKNRATDGVPYSGATYNDFKMSTAALLTYALPHRNLRITGKGHDPTRYLSSADVTAAVAADDYDAGPRSNSQLISDLENWSPVVRKNAAVELGTRSVSGTELNQITTMANNTGEPVVSRAGACLALGEIGDSSSAAPLAALLTDSENYVRYSAAEAMRYLPTSASLAEVDTILAAAASTAAPLYPMVEEDPLQFAHGRVAILLFYSGSAYGPRGIIYGDQLDGIDRGLLYPAIEAIAQTPVGFSRGCLSSTYDYLTEADVMALSGSIIDSIIYRAPADKMFSNGVRSSGVRNLERFDIAEGVPACMVYTDDEAGGRRNDPLELLGTFGAGVHTVVPDPDVIGFLNDYVAISETSAAAQGSIDAINADTDPTPLMSLKSIQSASADATLLTMPTDSTTLRVTASDVAQGDSIFTWTKVSGPGAVTITPNGTSDTAGTLQIDGTPGNYEFVVTMSDSRGLTEAYETVYVQLTGSGGDTTPPIPDPIGWEIPPTAVGSAGPVAHDGFDYTSGGTLNGNGGTGFNGAWSTSRNGGGAGYFEVNSSGLSFTDAGSNALPVSGNSAYRSRDRGRSEANRVLSTASRDALLADGSTMWFSVLYTKTNSSEEAAFVIGTDTFNVGVTDSLNNYASNGQGFGFGSSNNNLVTALGYDSGVTEVDSSVDVSGGAKLIAGKIEWGIGGADDTLKLYDVTDLTTEPTSHIATVTANLNQANFDQVALFSSFDTAVFDEIRLGTSFASVVSDGGGSDTSITMTATTAEDASGVEYYFTCVYGGGNDSGWQDSPVYTDTGLTPGSQYAYTVMVRDKSPNQNTSAPSETASAVSGGGPGDFEPPTPEPASFALAPSATSDTEITMTATTGSDATGGIEYYFAEVSGNPGGNDSGWQSSPSFTDSGLDPETEYSYRVTMRDILGNVGTPSAATNATTREFSNIIPIVNPSFEDSASSATGWSSNMGGIKVALTAEEFGWDAPDGDNVIFAYAASQNTWQVLSSPLQANTTYTLQMDFMHCVGGEQAIKSMLVFGYGASGPSGGTQLASVISGQAGAPVPTSDDPAERTKTWTLTYTTGASPAGLGEPLWIQLGPDGSSNNGRAGYDNVRLTTGVDTDPPTPDPATFASAPAADSDTAISMTAITGSDSSGVEYLFTETSGNPGGTSSGWQSDPSYTDDGLTASTQYTYTVTMRDSLGNTGAASAGASATTQAASDTSPPVPNPASFASVPVAGGDTTISMTATTGSDPAGVEYLFTETSGNPGGTSSNWQSSPSYTDIGLSPSTQYTYTVTMRDSLGNTGNASAAASATTQAAPDTTPPTPNPASFASAPSADSDTAISMTAETGSDPSGVEYLFTETSGNPGATSSGWQSSPSYTDDGLSASTQYTYTVTMRDSLGNTGNASAGASATTQVAPDTTPPTPNPATFAVVPVADSDSAISMTATTGSDPSGPVEYLFTETSGNPGATSSGWQTSPVYTDTDLDAETEYTYTVTLRDALGNTGSPSGVASATTSAAEPTNTIPIVEVFGHNEKDNFGGNIGDLINGSGMNGNGVDGVAGWPSGEDAPENWTATSNHYQSEWQSQALVSAGSNSKIGWAVLDLGSSTADLDSLYLWNVRENSGRYTASFNVYLADAPTSSMSHGPIDSTALDYDFASGGWTLVNTGGALTGTFQGDQVVDLAGGTARYVGIEILSNGGDANRVGFAEVAVTTSGGGSSVTVPDVVGLAQATAESNITGAGLAVGTVSTASSSSVPAGDVISQNPTGGSSVASGSAVDLVVSTGPPLVSVPDVVGQAQATAESNITGAGLTVGTVSTASSSSVPAGDVISQNPTGGSSVASGSAVDLVVSTGPPLVSVPDVVGQDQATAEANITAAGLTVGTVTNASSETVPAGDVISQNPTGGSSVASGSAVDLVVSTGPAMVTVPDVVGLSQAAAESAIVAAGLTVGSISTAYSETVPEDDVISQGLTAGSSVPPASAVDLVVSLGVDASPKLVRTTVSAVSNTNWTTVSLGQTYNSAVIIATPIYTNNTDASVVTRITNVTSTSFDLKLDRADALTDPVSMDVSVIAVDEGVYTQAVDGVTMEAVKFTSTVTGGKSNWLTTARSYQNSYTNPVVVGQVMSANGADWSVFWSTGPSRQDPADASNLNIGKHVAEDPNTTRADETIGYIVIEQGSGSINGVAYEAALGADTVRGLNDSVTPYTYSLTGGLSSASAAAVSISAMDGNNGAWGVLAGSPAVSSTSIGMYAVEDQVADSERAHTTTQMSYIVFE